MGSSPIRRIESRKVATCDSVAAGEQLHAGCCEFGAVGTPARERVDGQQVLSNFLMRKGATQHTKPLQERGQYENKSTTEKRGKYGTHKRFL